MFCEASAAAAELKNLARTAEEKQLWSGRKRKFDELADESNMENGEDLVLSGAEEDDDADIISCGDGNDDEESHETELQESQVLMHIVKA